MGYSLRNTKWVKNIMWTSPHISITLVISPTEIIGMGFTVGSNVGVYFTELVRVVMYKLR